jgi:hypothetical protein
MVTQIVPGFRTGPGGVPYHRPQVPHTPQGIRWKCRSSVDDDGTCLPVAFVHVQLRTRAVPVQQHAVSYRTTVPELRDVVRRVRYGTYFMQGKGNQLSRHKVVFLALILPRSLKAQGSGIRRQA